MEKELRTGDGFLNNKDTWSTKGHRGMRRGEEGPAGEAGGQVGKLSRPEDTPGRCSSSLLHIQGVTHLPHRFPWANRSLLILTLLPSFISFVYPVPLPEETYKPFSWSHVVLPQMIHPQKGPLEDKAVSRQGLNKPFGLASLDKSSQGPISVLWSQEQGQQQGT